MCVQVFRAHELQSGDRFRITDFTFAKDEYLIFDHWQGREAHGFFHDPAFGLSSLGSLPVYPGTDVFIVRELVRVGGTDHVEHTHA